MRESEIYVRIGQMRFPRVDWNIANHMLPVSAHEMKLSPEEELANSVYVAPADSYEPKIEAIELLSRRIKQPKREERRDKEVTFIMKKRYLKEERDRVQRGVQFIKPHDSKKDGWPNYFKSRVPERQDWDSEINGHTNSYGVMSELERRTDSLGYYDHTGKVLRVYDKFPQVLKLLSDGEVAEKILEEYTLKEALTIQNRLDRADLKLHEMMGLGKFIMGERSGKLYLVDRSIEAIIGRERLTADEFFNTDRKNEFLHLQYRDIFTYVIQKPRSITGQDFDGIFMHEIEPKINLRNIHPNSKTEH